MDMAKVIAFSNFDWAGSLSNRKSTTGYYTNTMVRGNLVSWKSKKQVVTAKSSAETGTECRSWVL